MPAKFLLLQMQKIKKLEQTKTDDGKANKK